MGEDARQTNTARAWRGLLVVLALLFGGLAAAQDHRLPALPDPKLEALIERMDEVQKNLQTLRVSFTQTNQFQMLSKPQVLSGRLLLKKPETALYEYATPSRLFFLVKDGDLLVYSPGQKKVVVQDIRRHQARIIRYLGISQPLRELQESFRIEWAGQDNGTIHLNLVPTKLKLKHKIASLQFWVDAQTACLKGFEVVEAEGDRIRFDFSQWETNPALSESDFKVEIPPGTKVHRQMLDLQEPFQH